MSPMEKKQQIKKRLANSNELPAEVLGVKLSETDKEHLCWGGWSELKQDLHSPDGSVKDGKFKITRNPKGEIEFNFLFKKDILIIPDKIGNKKLSKEQQEELTHGKTVLVHYESNEFYLKIDKELNTISISTGREIGIPDELGEYKLSEQDKENLANNKPLGTKVFKGKDGFFLANVRISEDRKEIIFMDIKSIDKQVDIDFYKNKFNKEIINTFDSNISIENVLSVVEPTSKIKIDYSDGLQGEVLKAIVDKDFSKVREIKLQGYIPNENDIKFIQDTTKCTTTEKSAFFTILGVNEPSKNITMKDNLNQSDIFDSIQESYDNQSDDRYYEMNKEMAGGNKSQTYLSKEFILSIDEKAIDKLKELTNNGFSPTEKELNYLVVSTNYTEQEKQEVLSFLKVEPDKKQEADIKIGQISEFEKKEKELKPKNEVLNKTPNEGLKKAERLITQAFDGM